MKMLIISGLLSLFTSFNAPTSETMPVEDACTATISNGDVTISCTASTCAAAKQCAICAFEAQY